MATAAPMRGNRRGICRGIGMAVVIIPLAGWLLANLWLACPPGRRWIAAKIQSPTGLETIIGGASITPWNGLCLRQVELLQPAALRASQVPPFARIGTIHLSPRWRSWLRGGNEIKSLDLDSPHFAIPIAALAGLSRPPAATPVLPTLAAITPQIGPSQPTGYSPPVAPTPTGSSPPVTSSSPVASTPPAASSPPVASKPPLPATVNAAPPVQQPPTSWLRLKNASFTVLSNTPDQPGVNIAGLDAAVPIGGQAAQAPLHIRAIVVAGHEMITDFNGTLEWSSPLLSLKPCTTRINGCNLTIAAKLATLQGIPVQLEVQIPRQPLASLPLPADGHAEAESVSALARFRGFMLAPGSWQGELLVETVAPSASIGGHETKFHRGSAITILNGGVLSCIDARLIGDDLSLLGNATLLADGRAAAALRLVAPPDTAAAITRRAFPNMPQPPALTPLATPQRVAFDVQAFGHFNHMSLQLGCDGPLVDFIP